MPISLENNETEAASRLRNDKPVGVDRDKDCRPEHSAYASEVCAVYFQGNGPLHIPLELLHQSAELASRDMAMGCDSSSFRELHLDDIAYDTGHVLIHFLHTGSYQCLKPQGDTTAKRYTSEFATALRAYVVAQSLQLLSLRDLARGEMIRLGNKLSLLSLIDIMEESWLSLSTSPGIVAYAESRFLAFAESVTHPIAEKVLSEIGTPNTLSKVLLKTMLLLKTSEVPQRDGSFQKEVLVEILRGLTDSKPEAGASRSKVSDVDQAMKEAEEQVAREAEEQAAKDAEEAAAIAVAQRTAAAEADEAEAAREEKEIAALSEKKERRGKLLKRDQERLFILWENASRRAEARAAREVAEAGAARISTVFAATEKPSEAEDKHADEVKPAEEETPAEEEKPAEAEDKPADDVKPLEEEKSAEAAPPADEKKTSEDTPAEEDKPTEDDKAASQEAEAVAIAEEEAELAALAAKKAKAKKRKLNKADTQRFNILIENAAKRAEAKAAAAAAAAAESAPPVYEEEIFEDGPTEEDKTSEDAPTDEDKPAEDTPPAEEDELAEGRVASAEQSFVFPTPEGE